MRRMVAGYGNGPEERTNADKNDGQVKANKDSGSPEGDFASRTGLPRRKSFLSKNALRPAHDGRSLTAGEQGVPAPANQDSPVAAGARAVALRQPPETVQPNETGEIMKRWLILLFAGVIVAGTAFLNIWSIMQKPLLALFPGSTPSEVVLVYSLTLAAMGLTSPFAGRAMDKFGPRIVLIFGCIMWCVGVFLTSFATELWHIYVTYCLLIGVGDGLLYTNCVVNAVKWFPDRKALAAGIIATFGALGPMVWVPIALNLMDGASSVLDIYQGFAVIFVFSMLLLAFFVVPPAPGYKPEGWDPSKAASKGKGIILSHKGISGIVKDPVFYAVVLTFMCGTGTGGMMVGHSAAIGINQIGMTPAVAASTVTVFALCNAAGRIVFGWCSDNFGRFITQGCVFLIYIIGANVLNIATTTPMFMIGCGLIACGWGGTWASYPAITSEFWGPENLGANYGLVFIGASIGGFVYPKIAGYAVETTGHYTLAYICAMAFAAAGIVIVYWMSTMYKKRAALLKN